MKLIKKAERQREKERYGNLISIAGIVQIVRSKGPDYILVSSSDPMQFTNPIPECKCDFKGKDYKKTVPII